MVDPILTHAALGHDVAYPQTYDPSILFAIDRSDKRRTLSLQPPPDWHGADIWNAYELSWLNSRGKPVVATACCVFPQDSARIVESKSFKLYLNSFNESRFDSADAVRRCMEQDLARACGSAVAVHIQAMEAGVSAARGALGGSNIDGIDIDITHYQPAPELLRCAPGARHVNETLVSDLLKTNCPVTGQPDWGSVQIRYSGPQIDHAALLAYIVSLRHHQEFHEHCVERMYCDIWRACRPGSLFVYARYTRRGGLDINPWRSSQAAQVLNQRTTRQ